MPMKRFLLALGVIAAWAVAQPASARPASDCPLRDAPFSIDSPLVDILLSPAARAVLEKAAPGRFSKLPPRFAGAETPTFAAILTLREASAFTGLKPHALGAIDPQLRALPVTQADKLARCARYDDDRPTFSLPKGKLHLLLFEKINGF